VVSRAVPLQPGHRFGHRLGPLSSVREMPGAAELMQQGDDRLEQLARRFLA
jgi:hypothetical protein